METVTGNSKKTFRTNNAFISPFLPLGASNVRSSFSNFDNFNNRSRLTSKYSRISTRRLRANAGPEPTEPPESQSEGPGLSGIDTEGSDLALPDLRRLFDEGGDPDCPQCEGEGEIDCVVCDGKGFITLTMMGTTSSSQCRMCKGRGRIPCPSCRTHVFKSVLWWDKIPSPEEDPDEEWREGPDGQPRIPWNTPPAGP